MKLMQESIGDIARRGISLLDDSATQRALEAAYSSQAAARAVQTSEAVFKKLTTVRNDPEIVCAFLAGWRAMHGTALYVSGLMVRLLRERAVAHQPAAELIGNAAAEIAEIIAEDTGVADIPHNELFAEFARTACGDNRWELAKYNSPACDRFRAYVKDARLHGPIQAAILTTAASENWNTGEYTFFSASVVDWLMASRGLELNQAEKAARYVTAHAGNTELGHFLHAITAWKHYCAARQCEVDPELARTVTETYLSQVEKAFEALYTLF